MRRPFRLPRSRSSPAKTLPDLHRDPDLDLSSESGGRAERPRAGLDDTCERRALDSCGLVAARLYIAARSRLGRSRVADPRPARVRSDRHCRLDWADARRQRRFDRHEGQGAYVDARGGDVGGGPGEHRPGRRSAAWSDFQPVCRQRTSRAVFRRRPTEVGDYTLGFAASAGGPSITRTYRIRVNPDIRYPHSYALTDARIGHWARRCRQGRSSACGPARRHARHDARSLDPRRHAEPGARSRRHRFEPDEDGVPRPPADPAEITQPAGCLKKHSAILSASTRTRTSTGRSSRSRSSET